MKPLTLSSNEREAALRRAIIRAIPEYYAWPKAKQEQCRLNISSDKDFRVRQSLLKILFNIDTNSEEQLDAALNEFDDEQYLLLNSTLLPFQGIGENNFFLNEYLADEVTLLDFPTLGDYARDDHHFQQQARKQEDPTYEIQTYRGNLFPTWARLTIDGEFSYATLFSLAARLRDVIDETGTERINQLIPHDYIEGKNHGKQEQQGTLFDLHVDAAGKEPQLDELQHRFYQYMHTRYEQLLEQFDKESKQQVYIQRIEQDQEPHINFVFSDKSAFYAIRLRHFYNDCEHIAGDIVELDALAEQEQKEAVKFLDKNYHEILDNYDPSVIRLWKKRKIILADGVLDDLL
ncbi:hypothetical protein MNBD_GAMMA24-689 [hydrothermal vent metagenome]|uniref:Uncharacterized protein n=1 Tax=hydrothermal vent metagenome TaxID=652676 RepID=A0A3B1B2P7_9ZZZZ